MTRVSQVVVRQKTLAPLSVNKGAQKVEFTESENKKCNCPSDQSD